MLRMIHRSLAEGSRAWSMTILVLVLIGAAVVESRPMSPTTVSHRKPPFNGSIFGKRSGSLPRALPGQGIVLDLDDGGYMTRTESPIEALALMVKEQEGLIRAAFNQCAAQQKLNLGKYLAAIELVQLNL